MSRIRRGPGPGAGAGREPARARAAAAPGEGSGGPAVARIALAAAGLFLAAYLTLFHYDHHVVLLCKPSGIIDCAAVLTSPQSVVLGVPIALWGVLWFAVAGALGVVTLVVGRGRRFRSQGSPASRRRRTPDPAPWLRPARLWWSAVGALSVVYFVYLELLVVGRICLWCSCVHLIVLALLAMEVSVAADGRARG